MLSPWPNELGSESEGQDPFQHPRKGRTAMDPNSYPFLQAHQAEHAIRLRRSERRRDAEQAYEVPAYPSHLRRMAAELGDLEMFRHPCQPFPHRTHERR